MRLTPGLLPLIVLLLFASLSVASAGLLSSIGSSSSSTLGLNVGLCTMVGLTVNGASQTQSSVSGSTRTYQLSAEQSAKGSFDVDVLLQVTAALSLSARTATSITYETSNGHSGSFTQGNAVADSKLLAVASIGLDFAAHIDFASASSSSSSSGSPSSGSSNSAGSITLHIRGGGCSDSEWTVVLNLAASAAGSSTTSSASNSGASTSGSSNSADSGSVTSTIAGALSVDAGVCTVASLAVNGEVQSQLTSSSDTRTYQLSTEQSAKGSFDLALVLQVSATLSLSGRSATSIKYETSDGKTGTCSQGNLVSSSQLLVGASVGLSFSAHVDLSSATSSDSGASSSSSSDSAGKITLYLSGGGCGNSGSTTTIVLLLSGSITSASSGSSTSGAVGGTVASNSGSGTTSGSAGGSSGTTTSTSGSGASGALAGGDASLTAGLCTVAGLSVNGETQTQSSFASNTRSYQLSAEQSAKGSFDLGVTLQVSASLSLTEQSATTITWMTSNGQSGTCTRGSSASQLAVGASLALAYSAHIDFAGSSSSSSAGSSGAMTSGSILLHISGDGCGSGSSDASIVINLDASGSSSASNSVGPSCTLESVQLGGGSKIFFPTWSSDRTQYWSTSSATQFRSTLTATATEGSIQAIISLNVNGQTQTMVSGVESGSYQLNKGSNQVVVTVQGVECTSKYIFTSERPNQALDVGVTAQLYDWNSSSYSACSGVCTTNTGLAAGTFARLVACEGEDGSVVSDSQCSGTKPVATNTCNTICSTVQRDGATIGTQNSAASVQASLLVLLGAAFGTAVAAQHAV